LRKGRRRTSFFLFGGGGIEQRLGRVREAKPLAQLGRDGFRTEPFVFFRCFGVETRRQQASLEGREGEVGDPVDLQRERRRKGGRQRRRKPEEVFFLSSFVVLEGPLDGPASAREHVGGPGVEAGPVFGRPPARAVAGRRRRRRRRRRLFRKREAVSSVSAGSSDSQHHGPGDVLRPRQERGLGIGLFFGGGREGKRKERERLRFEFLGQNEEEKKN